MQYIQQEHHIAGEQGIKFSLPNLAEIQRLILDESEPMNRAPISLDQLDDICYDMEPEFEFGGYRFYDSVNGGGFRFVDGGGFTVDVVLPSELAWSLRARMKACPAAKLADDPYDAIYS